MDGLALLCNLHADGPLSLRRLRASGVRALEDLGSLPEGALAATLKASPSQVRRFQHEGQLLSRRLKELSLEPERNPDEPIPGEVRARLLRHIVRPPVGYDTHPPDVPASAVPGSGLGDPQSAAARAQTEPASRGLPAVFPTGTPLASGAIPGLDARTCQRLVAQGVRTYKALVDLASLNLARGTGIPFTRLLDLRHHARRFLEGRLMPGQAVAPSAAARRKEPSEPQVEIKPQPRRVCEPQSALRMERVAQGPALPIPASPELPATLRNPGPEEPGVAGPFV